jgi:hypothetical protein
VKKFAPLHCAESLCENIVQKQSRSLCKKLTQKKLVKKFVPLPCVKILCKNNQEACVRIDTKKTCEEEVCALALCGELVRQFVY